MADAEPFILETKRDDKNSARDNVVGTESSPRSTRIELPGSFRLQAIIVLLLQLAIFVFLIVTICIPISIVAPGYGGLAPKRQFLYITCVSIAATLVSAMAASALRIVYLKKLEPEVSERKMQRASTIVGLGSVTDKLRHWPISGTFLIVALISAGIISAVTPDYFSFEYPLTASIYPDHVQGYGNDVCFTNGGAGSVDGFVWKLANGSSIGINETSLQYCESQRVLYSLTQSNSIQLGDDLAYSMGGVPVAVSAAGAPFSVLQNTFSNAFGLNVRSVQSGFWTELESASVCLPMLSHNPVSCRQEGNLTISGRNMTVSSSGCLASSNFATVDPSTQGATVAGGCAGKDEGTATLVIGAVGPHVEELALAVGAFSDLKSIAITCSVDIKPAISVRRLKIARYSKQFLLNTNYNFQFSVTTDDSNTAPCQGDINPSSVSTSTVLAVGASAAWQLFQERKYVDGRLVTVLNRCYNPWKEDGRNGCLEGILGIASAMGTGMYWARLGLPRRSAVELLRRLGLISSKL